MYGICIIDILKGYKRLFAPPPLKFPHNLFLLFKTNAHIVTKWITTTNDDGTMSVKILTFKNILE